MAADHELSPCMYGHRGSIVSAWLAEMQSTEFLRQSIARGHRTAECWDELQKRSQRRHAFRRLLPGFRAAPAGVQS